MLKKNLKKYIVFQIWGNNPLFLIGMIENIKLATIIYPSWKVRIYYSDIPDHFLIRLKKCNIELISEKINDKIKYQIWRILPLFDKRVDIFICREARLTINQSKHWIVIQCCISKILTETSIFTDFLVHAIKTTNKAS